MSSDPKNAFPRAPRTFAGLLALAAMTAAALPANAAGPFANLGGSWSGGGSASFEGGQTERLRCSAFYNSSSNGNALSLALRCASTSAKIDLRGRLNYSGGTVTGSWEERSYNASGNASGSASNSGMRLRFTGGASGFMSVAATKSGQSVSLTSQGTSLRSVRVSLSRR